MKNLITILSGIFFGVFTLLVVMSIYADVTRSMELQSSFPSFVESALEEDLVSGVYGKEDLELFIHDFAVRLASSWENQSDMTISVMQYEPELGILSLRVTAQYKKPFGGTKIAACERTIILNRQQE